MLSDYHTDALGELVHIGVGRAAGSLSQMLSQRIRLHIPQLRLLSLTELANEFEELIGYGTSNAVHVRFEGQLKGAGILTIPEVSAVRMAGILAPKSQMAVDPGQMVPAMLTEVGSILINGMIGSLANALDLRVTYSVPIHVEGPSLDVLQLPGHGETVQALLTITRIDVCQQQIYSKIIIVLEVNSFNDLLGILGPEPDGHAEDRVG